MFLLIADPPTTLCLIDGGLFFVKTALGKKEMKIGMTTAMPDEMTKTVPPEQTEQDEEILRLIRELGYGKIVITVKNGQPVHA